MIIIMIAMIIMTLIIVIMIITMILLENDNISLCFVCLSRSSSTMRSSLLEIIELAARGWPSPQFTLPYSPPPMPPGEKKL